MLQESSALEVCFNLRDVQKTYGRWATNGEESPRPALNIRNLNIYESQSTAILGYSGSGKSTLLNLLSLLDLPDDNGGDISFRGLSYRSIRNDRGKQDRLRRDSFGFVFQDNHLLEHLNSCRNVGLALAIQGLPLTRCDQAAQALLTQVGIGHKTRALPQELSGGEKQRVAVMRAIAHNPSVVFADEPTGNLDWDTGLLVMERLATWKQENNGTLVIVSHNIHQIFDFADRFIMLKDGQVIFSGYHAEHGRSLEPDEGPVAGPDELTDVLKRHSRIRGHAEHVASG